MLRFELGFGTDLRLFLEVGFHAEGHKDKTDKEPLGGPQLVVKPEEAENDGKEFPGDSHSDERERAKVFDCRKDKNLSNGAAKTE